MSQSRFTEQEIVDASITQDIQGDRRRCLDLVEGDPDRDLATEPVTQSRVGNPEHSGREGRSTSPARQSTTDLEEGVPQDVLGLSRVAESLHGEAGEALDVQFGEATEKPGVPSRETTRKTSTQGGKGHHFSRGAQAKTLRRTMG